MKITSKKIAELMVEKLKRVSSKEERVEVIKTFAKLLQQEGKISKVKDISSYFSKFWNKTHKEIDVVVETPTEKHPHLPTHIGEYKLNVSHKLNPELLAGVNISFEDYSFSKNLKKDLANLKAL